MGPKSVTKSVQRQGSPFWLKMVETGVEVLRKWMNLTQTTKDMRDVRTVMRLSKSLTIHLDQQWHCLLSQLRKTKDPAMLCYMGDGWATKIWATSKSYVGGALQNSCDRVKREFLLERGILKVAAGSGDMLARVLPKAPRPLECGKTSWELFTSLNEFELPLRFYSDGPVVSFYCFDGLHFWVWVWVWFWVWV